MRPRPFLSLPAFIRAVAGAALGFAVAGASAWDVRVAVFGTLAGALVVAVAGGGILGTTAWAMIGGAMVGGMVVGVACILSLNHIKGAFYGCPLGAVIGHLIGIRLESATRGDEGSKSAPSSAVWDRESGRSRS